MIDQTNRKTILYYTVIFVITSVISFGVFVIFGKTFLWNADGFTQHYPLLVELRNIVKELLLNRKFYFWADDIGMGADVIGNMSIILADPFNYIAAAFPVKYIDIGYSIACVLRMYVAGISMIFFLKYHGYGRTKMVIGGISYALSYWAVGVINHGFFLLPLILFPLVILGIDKVFDGKSPVLLVVSVAASLITYLYFAYMTAISVFIYIVVKYLWGQLKQEKSFGDFAGLAVKFIAYVLIACCIAAPILFSMLYSILSASKTTGMNESWIPALKEIIRYLPALVNNMEVFGNYSYIGTNALLTLLLPLIFIKGYKHNKVPVVMLGFYSFMIIVPFWGRLMNAFSYRMGRWCYVFVFFYVYAAIDNLDVIKALGEKDRKLCYCWIVVIFLCNIVGKVTTQAFSTAAATVGFWNIFCMILLLNDLLKQEISVYLFLIINIGMSYALTFSPGCADRVSSYLDQGIAYKAYNSSVLRVYPKLAENDRDFFRIDYNEHVLNDLSKYRYICTPSNENMYWSARSLTGYLSTFAQNALEFQNGLLNSASNYRRTCTYSNDNRSRLNFLTGIKYYLYETDSSYADKQKEYAGYGYEEDTVSDGVGICHNVHEPGLGYVFTTAMDQKEYETLTPLEKEQALMQHVILDYSDTGDVKISKDIESDVRELSYSVADNSQIQIDHNRFNVGASSQKLILSVEAYSNSELYVVFDGLSKESYTKKEWMDISRKNSLKNSRSEYLKYSMSQISEKAYGNFEYIISSSDISKRVIMTDGDPQGFSDTHLFMSDLGYHENGSEKIEISFNTPGKYQFEDLKVYVVPMDSFERQAKELSEHRYSVEKYEPDHIIGNVATDEDGVLFVNLPYHPGWKAYVDGKKADVSVADICFLGVPVSAGTHTVELVFRPIGFRLSLLLCCIGIGCTVFLIIFWKKKVNVHEKKQEIIS